MGGRAVLLAALLLLQLLATHAQPITPPERCDLACFLGNLTLRFGEQGIISSVVCSGLQLDDLSSTFAPPDAVALNVGGLQLQCVVTFERSTIVVEAQQSSLAGTLFFVKDNSTGLVSQARFDQCSAVMNFGFSGSVTWIIKEVLRVFEFFFKGAIERRICDALSSQVAGGLTTALRHVNAIITPFLAAQPLPPSPDYGPRAMNLTGNPVMALLDFALNQLTGLNGPFGIGLVVAELTNHTGVVQHRWDNDTVSYTLAVPGVGNASFGLREFSASGLDSFDALQLLVPRDVVTLDNALRLRELAINASFFVSVALDGTQTDSQTLFERGALRFSASDVSVLASLALGFDQPMLERLSFGQVTPGCVGSALLGANVTQALAGFSLRDLLLEARDGGALERELDTLLDNVLLLFVSSYRHAIPAFVNGLLLQPALRDASHAGPIVAPCALAPLSSSSSVFPLNRVAMGAVLGGLFAALAGVLAGVALWHREWFSPSQAELDADADEAYEEGAGAAAERLSLMINSSSSRSTMPVGMAAMRPLPPMGLDPRLPWIVRLGVPLLLLVNIAIFILSNTSVGAAVFVFVHLGARVLQSSSLFSFTLANSVHDMWEAGVYTLSLVIALFSGAWPYLKLLLMLFVWFMPAKVASGAVRERVLMLLDSLGKWSLVDSFVLVFMMVAFRFNIVIPASPLAQTAAGLTSIDLIVEADMGFYVFLWATMLSLVLTHVLLAVHRWLSNKTRSDAFAGAADGDTDDYDDVFERTPLFNVPFSLKGTRVRYTRFGAAFILLLMVVSLALIIAGALTDTFVFHFEGAAGAVFPYAGVKADRGFSLVSLALALPGAALEPNSFGVRSVQATFVLFAFVVPLVYLVALVLLWALPLRGREHSKLFHVVEVLRAWSAMEVFVLAVVAALTELEQFAQFLVGDRCDFINPTLARFFSGLLNGNPKCFDVTTTLAPGCWLQFGACLLYIVAGTVVIRVCHRVIEARHGREERHDGKNVHAQHWRTRLWLALRIVREA